MNFTKKLIKFSLNHLIQEEAKKPVPKIQAPETPKIEVVKDKSPQPDSRKNSLAPGQLSPRRGSLVPPDDSRRPSLLISDEVLLYFLKGCLISYNLIKKSEFSKI